jgi:hypothetical protein
MCQLVPVSRRSFYRSRKEQQPAEEELEVRSAIQQIALEHRRRYGYRRITAELHRRGMHAPAHVSERYEKLLNDRAYRLDWAERVGTGFALPVGQPGLLHLVRKTA